VKLVSIEPTPSPNTMKLNVDETLPHGVQREYTPDKMESVPPLIRRILAIDGVRSIFHTADFLAIERKTNADWQVILTGAREAFGETGIQPSEWEPVVAVESWGEAKVYIQFFRNIPMQVKVTAGSEQIRAGLPERFGKAAMTAGSSSPNLIMERQWVELGIRYGDLREIGEEVAQEVDAAYDDTRLNQLVELAISQGTGDPHPVPEPEAQPEITLEILEHPDWQKRYAALEKLNPEAVHLPILVKALHDPKPSIRRLATVYLGMVGGDEVLPYLFEALKDDSVSVRRTAGDTLSDLGDPKAIGPMAEALKDPNKLVRWRAARFLYEVGDETALDALRDAQDDPEFEVRMQIRMALERIERGEAASGTVWQQMTRRNE
jgi:hypothetical protein